MPRRPGPPTALIAARYELLRELRVDSEAVDWEGFDTRLERAVIVRLLRPDLADDAGASDRFWRAVRADALQTHDPDRRVLDGGTDAETGRPFVVRALPTDVAGVAEQPRAAASATPTIVAQPRRSRFAGSGRWIAVGAVAVAALVVIALRPGVEGWLAWVNTPAARTGVSFVLAAGGCLDQHAPIHRRSDAARSCPNRPVRRQARHARRRPPSPRSASPGAS